MQGCCGYQPKYGEMLSKFNENFYLSNEPIFFIEDGIDTVEEFFQIINTYSSMLDSHGWN